MRTRIVTVVAAVAVALGGYLHLEIWRGGYRYAPVKEMFLLNVGISAVVALALLIHPGKLTALAGLVLSAGSLAAFGLSRGPGLPTLHGIFTEKGLAPLNVRFLGGPAAVTLLAAEAIVVIGCAVVLLNRQVSAAKARPWEPVPAPVAVAPRFVQSVPRRAPTAFAAPAMSLHEALIQQTAARWPAIPAASIPPR